MLHLGVRERSPQIAASVKGGKDYITTRITEKRHLTRKLRNKDYIFSKNWGKRVGGKLPLKVGGDQEGLTEQSLMEKSGKKSIKTIEGWDYQVTDTTRPQWGRT